MDWDKVAGYTKNAMDTVAGVVDETYSKSKRYLGEKRVEHRLRKAYEHLGILMYLKEKGDASVSEQIPEVMERIDNLKETLATFQNQRQRQQQHRFSYCDVCGEPLPDDAAVCPKCGAAQGE